MAAPASSSVLHMRQRTPRRLSGPLLSLHHCSEHPPTSFPGSTRCGAASPAHVRLIQWLYAEQRYVQRYSRA